MSGQKSGLSICCWWILLPIKIVLVLVSIFFVLLACFIYINGWWLMMPEDGANLRAEDQQLLKEYPFDEGDDFERVQILSNDGLTYTVMKLVPERNAWCKVIMVHGFPDNQLSFVTQARHFQSQGCAVWLVPLRGYQVSYIPPNFDYSILSAAKDLISMMKQQDILNEKIKPHIVGHDWGSAVVQMAAKLEPTIFSSVTMISVPQIKFFEENMGAVPVQFQQSWYMFFFQFGYINEWWLDIHTSAHGIKFLYNQWQRGGTSYQHARLNSVIATLRQPGVLQAALGWYHEDMRKLIWALLTNSMTERQRLGLEYVKKIY